ncbi:MAG: alpha/beta hydrolase-fold protein, partial [Planctomycetota bacterium]
DAELGDIGNRVLEPVSADRVTPGQPTVYEFTIPAFADQRDGAVTFGQDGASLPVEVSAGTLRRLEIAGGGGDAAGSIRELLVWLPEGYFDEANADRRYPVLYLHDGQNLFDTMPGGPEEWGADETAARLIEEGKVEPLIIVGIPHAGAARLSEYLPLPTPELDVAAGGEAYRRFFYSQLVPRVDRAFRTSTRSADRGIGGASMGGLISLYIASRDFNAQIGKVLAESPTLSFSEDPSYWQILFEPTSFAWRQRVLLNMGRFEVDADAAENEANQRVQTAAFELSQAAQPASPGFRYVLDEDGRHNEATWGSRFEQALIELFPAE